MRSDDADDRFEICDFKYCDEGQKDEHERQRREPTLYSHKPSLLIIKNVDSSSCFTFIPLIFVVRKLIFEAISETSEYLDLNLAAIFSAHHEIALLFADKFSLFLEIGFQFCDSIAKFDLFELALEVVLCGFFIDGQDLIDLHLVLLDGDAVYVLVTGLHHTPALLHIYQIAVLPLHLTQRFLQGINRLFQSNDLTTVQLLLLQQLLPQILNHILIMLGIFIQKVLLPQSQLLASFTQIQLQLFILGLQLAQHLLCPASLFVVLFEGSPQAGILLHQVLAVEFQTCQLLLIVADLRILILFVCLITLPILNDTHEFSLCSFREVHDAPDEAVLDGASDADDEDQQQQRFETFLRLPLRHLHQVYRRQTAGRRQLKCFSEICLHLLVHAAETTVVLFPFIRTCACCKVKSINLTKQLFQETTIANLDDAIDGWAIGSLPEPQHQCVGSAFHYQYKLKPVIDTQASSQKHISINLLFLSLAPFVVLLVRIVDSIEKVENRSIVTDILFVMEVMVGSACTEWQELRLSPGPIVTAVPVAGLEHAHGDPDEDGEDVDWVDLRQKFIAKPYRDGVSNDVFNGMRVLGCYGHSYIVFMMFLVDPVEFGVVHDAVHPIEAKLPHQHEQAYLPEHSPGRWNFLQSHLKSEVEIGISQ